MDPSRTRETARRMTAGRAVLLKEYPFFGCLLMRLCLSCDSCGTACTDGTRLIFDPDFADRLSDGELRFVMLHEALHCALRHCFRSKGLHPPLYNIACDIVVNSTILQMQGLKSFRIDGEEPIHTAPDGKEGHLYHAEQVYKMLLREHSAGGDGLPSGRGCDRHDLWGAISNSAALEDAWDGYLQEAGRAWGDTTGLPPQLRRLVDSLQHRSQVDWRQVLHDFLQHDRFDYSFCPPDRRFADSGFFFPAFHPDEENGSAGSLWLCIDTSASISAEELTIALWEVEDSMRQAGLTGWISYFDSEITPPEAFETAEDLRAIPPKGGGGTSFHVIFRCLQEQMSDDPPRAILIFTDGYADCPPETAALEVPVLWVLHRNGKNTMPWGQVVKIS